MAVFGYLYSTRSACMMHALPLRRETLFTTQYLAGLSFLLLPLAAVGIITLAAEMILIPSHDWAATIPTLGCSCWPWRGFASFSTPLHASAPCLPGIFWLCRRST